MLDFPTILHYTMHFIAPAGLALLFFGSRWKAAYGVMLATMFVDLDHFLATPIFDPVRCSIGFHPLHTQGVIALYVLMMFSPNFYIRAAGFGLVFHMITDYVNCLLV
ncbi:MAG: DUF6122 family protein [Candidatus Pacebacteria bacterium]|nr:DUF6122 family protein [Candidatus Paceibacterota bacterium]MCD8507847.1 DUF6122 family protein [Candidatus Paceibacterota bacterium]MCD8527820.1 DUF6122 family protein [Candidatus Paceibacterota bacterium]MCD8563526.1 DUF6122 family protein [Candidatus Paceibacterota bacterium]